MRIPDPVWRRKDLDKAHAALHKPASGQQPPASEFPLYLDRETGEDRDPDLYRDHVKLERRKRTTAAERLYAGVQQPG